MPGLSGDNDLQGYIRSTVALSDTNSLYDFSMIPCQPTYTGKTDKHYRYIEITGQPGPQVMRIVSCETFCLKQSVIFTKEQRLSAVYLLSAAQLIIGSIEDINGPSCITAIPSAGDLRYIPETLGTGCFSNRWSGQQPTQSKRAVKCSRV